MKIGRAVEFDVNYIFTNAEKFYQAESDKIRSASTVTDLFLKIIRNCGAVEEAASTSRPRAPTLIVTCNQRTQAKRNDWKEETTNCEPHSIEESSPTDLYDSNVKGKKLLCVKQFRELKICYEQQIWRTRSRK